MSNTIRAHFGLDRLVAERVMGWRAIKGPADIAMFEGYAEDCNPDSRTHLRCIWVSERGREACEECDNMPAWSSDPGEALKLLHEVNLRQAAKDRLPISLHASLGRRGLGYAAATIILRSVREEDLIDDPILAIIVRVLELHGVSREEMGEACRG